jgi:hypothetical protein
MRFQPSGSHVPAHSRRLSFVLGLACFSIYLWTLCPTVYLGDSGELTAAAHGLGIPHSSGYPLYALIGKIFCLIPVGSIGFRMNLMSAVLCALTVALVHDLLFRMTGSGIASFGSAAFLGFTSLFWSQAVSAEVYAFHILFVVILIRIVWAWDKNPEPDRLMLLAFVSGLSFGNHLQTIMLAPAILFIVLFHERGAFFRPKSLLVLSVLFIAALSVYLYFPLRTEAGASITWGDPNTWERFLGHVTAKTHRSGYILNMSTVQYLDRAWQSTVNLLRDFGVTLFFSCWGWVKIRSARWRVFCLLLVVFDFTYTVFLNTVSLKITPFNISTAVVLTLLMGLGIADFMNRIRNSSRLGPSVKRGVSGVFCLIPVMPLVFNLGLCDQSGNYTGYEHAVNVLRTAPKGSVLLIDGDNNVFPVIYARVCEGIGKDLKIMDRYNLVFRWPPPQNGLEGQGSLRFAVERMIQENGGKGVYLNVFDPNSFPLPHDSRVVPYGILGKLERGDSHPSLQDLRRLWRGYANVSFYEPMERDYMNRQVCSYFHFSLGRFFFECGLPGKGLESMRRASKIGYDDEMIHSDLGVFFTQRGFFEDAALELDLALLYAEDASMAYNNFGYYYDMVHEYDKSVASFQRAVGLSPRNHIYLNNLGLAFLKAGKRDQALSAWGKSLQLAENQPAIQTLMDSIGRP